MPRGQPSRLPRSKASSCSRLMRVWLTTSSSEMWFRSRCRRRNLSIQIRRELSRGELETGIERTELREFRARLVEAHLVNQFLEDERILREQIDAPLPVIEPDRPRDDLRDLARVVAADHAV